MTGKCSLRQIVSVRLLRVSIAEKMLHAKVRLYSIGFGRSLEGAAQKVWVTSTLTELGYQRLLADF